jgi:thiol-disulfide isomerase/thioredoxin
MLLITYGGRKLLLSHPFLLSHTQKIQKIFGVVMVITALAILFNIDRKFQTYILEKFPSYGTGLTRFEENETVKQELDKLQQKPVDFSQIGKPMNELVDKSDLGKAPELIPGGKWYNLSQGNQELTLSELRGKVVLVDFWTYTCINCIRTLPYLKAWHEKYKDMGLVIVGVHTPEFEFEKNPKNVEKAIRDFGLTYPIVQDNDYATWKAYDNHYWPAKYFIDKTGKIRKTHFGEGDYDESEQYIQKLLKETGEEISSPVINPTYVVQTKTPETYLGYDRLEYQTQMSAVVLDKPMQLAAPSPIPYNRFAYTGTVVVSREFAEPMAGTKLYFNFDSRNVYLVMRPKANTVSQIKVSLDGTVITYETQGADVKNGIVIIDSDRLYKLISLPTIQNHILELEFFDDNIQLYAFTFG